MWDHPIDLYYATRSIRGWPKLYIEVWNIDNVGRYSIGMCKYLWLAGYGITTIPFSPGKNSIEIKCWRPVAPSIFEKVSGKSYR